METAYENLTIHGHCNHEIFLCNEIILSVLYNYYEIMSISWHGYYNEMTFMALNGDYFTVHG